MHDYCPACGGDPRTKRNRDAHKLHSDSAACIECEKPLPPGRDSELCEDCEQRAAERSWERMQEGEPPPSLDEQHRAAWEEKQRLRR